MYHFSNEELAELSSMGFAACSNLNGLSEEVQFCAVLHTSAYELWFSNPLLGQQRKRGTFRAPYTKRFTVFVVGITVKVNQTI